MKSGKTIKIGGAVVLGLMLAGCMPAEIRCTLPSGGTVTMQFYPGSHVLDDLVILEGKNYFGTAQYQFDDPLGDLGFRLSSGERVRAECTLVGLDIIGQDECKRYEVYRSSWEQVPAGTIFERPEVF